jgi:plasmid maintenance system antidote protein VapI
MIDAPEIDPKAVARRMRIQCQRHDLTFPRLALAMGVKVHRVEELASGQVPIGPLMCAAMAPALRCTSRYLLTGKVAA